MKVIVDINKKTLKMLDNNRAVFKGEYGADKLQLYINKELENEYPVITGLLSNGRRIGAFTTDDAYEFETIDGVEYTRADFTLSKENGFSLSEGLTQITIWIYRTKDTTIISKEAIGNVVFTVVNTTAFNDGDIIIAGDVEGTVVNLKVEMENLQAKTEQYLPLTGGKPMTGNLKMKGNNIIFDNGKEETIKIGEDDDGYSMAIRIQDNDYYKSKYTGSGFSIGNDVINATLDISESKFEMTLGDEQAGMTPSGFSVRKEGTNTIYEDGKVTRYLDNYSKYVEIELPNESGTFETKENVSDLFAKNLTKENLSEIIKDATQSLSGLMSSQDKRHLDTLVNLLEENNDNVVNTINEILAIFNQYPEGAEILSVLSEKLNKSDLLPAIKEHAEQTSTLDIGTSDNYNINSDTEIPTTKAVKSIIDNSNSIIKITYDELKALRDNAQLIPGQQYQIIDYETTTLQPNTRSAGHQFDVIVIADDESTLNENAKACPHDGDLYFGGGTIIEKLYIGNFITGITPDDIVVAYTVCYDKDSKTYEGELKDGVDRIVELSYKNGQPVFYKNAVEYIESGEEGTDYNDEFIYNGPIEYDGEVYDSWKKIENGLDAKITIYTNIVVENAAYTEVEIKAPQNAKLDAWELKYSLDNNIFTNQWGADFISIRTDDFNEFEFQYVGSSTVNGVNYTLWKSSLYHTNVFGDTYLLIKGDLSKVEEGASVSLWVADPTGIFGDELEEDITVVTQVTRGKGVIYYMKDEYNNECFYDFKNIQFLRKGVDLYEIIGTPNDVSKIIDKKHKLLLELRDSSSYNYGEELTYGLTSFYIRTGLEIVNKYYGGDVVTYEDISCTRYITVDSNTLDSTVKYLIPINEYDYKWFYTFNMSSTETFINSEDATVGNGRYTTRNKISMDYKHFTAQNLPNIVFRYNHITDCCMCNCSNMFFNKSVNTLNFTNVHHICTLGELQSVDCNDSQDNVIYKNFTNVKLNRAICNFFGEITESKIGYSCMDNIIRSCTYTKIGEFCEDNDIQVKLSTIGKSLHSSEIVTTGYCHIGGNNDNIYVRGNYVVVGQDNTQLYIRGNHNTIGSKNDNVYLKGTANTIEDCVTDVRFVPENLTEEDSDEFNNYNCSNNIIKSHVNILESFSSVHRSIFNNYCNHINFRIDPREYSYAVERVIIEPYAQYMTLRCTNSLMDVLVKNHCNHFSTSYVSINIPEKPYGNHTVTVITDSDIGIEEIDIQQEGE